jgi:uncharacterized protein YndB with AHSA1/START domain
VSDERGVLEREIFIAASPEAVFSFLIDPALMTHWMGSSHKLEPRPGGIFQVEVSPGNIARGIFTEVTPPHRVAFTWGWESRDPELAILPPGLSLVEIELIRKEGGTLLRLRQSGLPERLSDIHRERWAVHLGCLQKISGERGRETRGSPFVETSSKP